MLKTQLDVVYDSYSGLIALIPDVEKRISELEGNSDDDDLRKMWNKVLKEIKHLGSRPKTLKMMYAKRIVKNIKKLREKYPEE